VETVREISAICFNVVTFVAVVHFTFKPCGYNVYVTVACVDFFVFLVLNNQNYLMYFELQGSIPVKEKLTIRNFCQKLQSSSCVHTLSPQSHLTLFSLLYCRYSK